MTYYQSIRHLYYLRILLFKLSKKITKRQEIKLDNISVNCEIFSPPIENFKYKHT